MPPRTGPGGDPCPLGQDLGVTRAPGQDLDWQARAGSKDGKGWDLDLRRGSREGWNANWVGRAGGGIRPGK